MPIAGALLAQAETAQANSFSRNSHKSLQPLRLAWTGWPAGTFHLYSALHGSGIHLLETHDKFKSATWSLSHGLVLHNQMQH